MHRPRPLLIYGVSATYSNVIYYLVKEGTDSPNNQSVYLGGLDLSFNRYLSDWLGYEVGLYEGRTSTLTLGGSYQNQRHVPLSSYTNMRSVSTYGGRMTLVIGYNLQSPGFKIHTGIGIYGERTNIERTNAGSSSETLMGTAFRFGLGYGWEKVSIEFLGSSRSGHPKGFVDGSGHGGWRLTYLY